MMTITGLFYDPLQIPGISMRKTSSDRRSLSLKRFGEITELTTVGTVAAKEASREGRRQ